VDGNPKLTLGLIWTIILHFQVSVRGFAKRDDKRDPPSYNDCNNDELGSVVRLSN